MAFRFALSLKGEGRDKSDVTVKQARKGKTFPTPNPSPHGQESPFQRHMDLAS